MKNNMRTKMNELWLTVGFVTMVLIGIIVYL
jgi:hypothetical protein